MPRTAKAQSTMFDRVIEDKELEALLAEEIRLYPDAQAYRTAKKQKRAYIEKHHPDIIATDDSDESKGWVRCGQYRFKPRMTEREAGEVRIGAGVNFSCPVERVE